MTRGYGATHDHSDGENEVFVMFWSTVEGIGSSGQVIVLKEKENLECVVKEFGLMWRSGRVFQSFHNKRWLVKKSCCGACEDVVQTLPGFPCRRQSEQKPNQMRIWTAECGEMRNLCRVLNSSAFCLLFWILSDGFVTHLTAKEQGKKSSCV